MKNRLNLLLKDFEQTSTDDTASWDSLAHLNLVIALDEELDIKITPEEIQLLYSNYDTIVRFIEAKQKQHQKVI